MSIYSQVDQWRLDLISNPPPASKMYSEEEWQHIVLNELVAGTSSMCGHTQMESTKELIAAATRRYWESEAGIEKKCRLSERNRRLKSDELKYKWTYDEKFKTKMFNRLSTKHTDEIKQLLSDSKKQYWNVNKESIVRKVRVDGVVYDNAKDAAVVYGIDPVNVRRRCRLEKFKNWEYV